MYPTKIWEYYLLWERRGEGISGTAAGIAKMLGREQKTDRTWLWGTTSFILGNGCPSWGSLSSDCQAIFSLHTMIHKIITSAQNLFFLNRGLLAITPRVTEPLSLIYEPRIGWCVWTLHVLDLNQLCTRGPTWIFEKRAEIKPFLQVIDYAPGDQF